MEARGTESMQVPPTWMPPRSGSFRNPPRIESGQFLPGWMPPQYGTVNNPLEWVPPPPADRMPLPFAVQSAYPTSGAEPRVRFTHMMYNQVQAEGINTPEGMYTGPSLDGSQPAGQPAGGTLRTSVVSQPAQVPRGISSSVFYGHMDSWHLRSLDPRQAADTVCPVSVPSQTDEPPPGMNPELFCAARTGDVKMLDSLLGRNLDVFTEMTPAEDTALHIAAGNGHQKFVEKLLELPGEQVEFLKSKNREGNTALHVAAVHGNATILQTLVDKYRDLAGVNNVDYRVLVYENNVAGETALFKAAEGGHAEIVENLLPLTPPDHNMKRSLDGQTPLHRAVFKAEKDVADKLIAHRPVLLREKDNEGLTPLHIAAFRAIPKSPPALFYMSRRKDYGNIRHIFKMLIEKDRSVCYMVDKYKQSPLHLAVIYGNPGLMDEILNHCEDCSDMVDCLGRNPLHLVVENASEIFHMVGPDIRDILIPGFLEKKFVNCTDNFGRTPLDIVTENLSTDSQLFHAIGDLLVSCGGHASPKWFQGNPRNFSPPVTTPWNSQIIAVNAVLLATVAFAVAFTLPGNHDSAEINSTIFQVLVIFDALAFCFSIVSAVLLIYALFISKVEDPLLAQKSMNALRVAMVSTGMTFGAAIHMVVAPKCLWLAVVVWVLVSYLPIWIAHVSLRGKLFLFLSPIETLRTLISEVSSILVSLCDPMVDSVICIFLVDAICFIYASLAKKMRRRKRPNNIL